MKIKILFIAVFFIALPCAALAQQNIFKAEIINIENEQIHLKALDGDFANNVMHPRYNINKT